MRRSLGQSLFITIEFLLLHEHVFFFAVEFWTVFIAFIALGMLSSLQCSTLFQKNYLSEELYIIKKLNPGWRIFC